MILVQIQLNCDKCFKSSNDILHLIGLPDDLHKLYAKAKCAEGKRGVI